MTSEERREARYRRRKAAREGRRRRRSEALGDISEVFSFRNMFRWGQKCCKNVMWKQSTQNFGLHLFSGTAKRRRNVLSGKWRPKPGAHFTIRERGKTRQIDAPHINDRQIHKVLTKEVLEPLYQPGMIYENGASQKGKGLSFHYKRLKKSLRDYYRKHGREGCIDLVDLTQFSPGAPPGSDPCAAPPADPKHGDPGGGRYRGNIGAGHRGHVPGRGAVTDGNGGPAVCGGQLAGLPTAGH